jgi:feruloyl esterase
MSIGWLFRARVLALGIPVVVLLTGPVQAQNAPQPFKDWKATSLRDPLSAEPHLQCEAVVSMTSYEFSILSATRVPATGLMPQFCRIVGQILPEVRFELSLPAQWNGRLYMFGNGGYAGEALDAPARVAIRNGGLLRGFAVVQTNTGHDAAVEPLGTFALNSQKLLDYAYRAVHVTTMTAKSLSLGYYGTPVRKSYFNGCSTGGRQGLMSAQRFPDDFDGIVVGAPVLDFAGTPISFHWNQKALAAGPISADQLKIVADAVYGMCDASDGLVDGEIGDPRRCEFKPAAELPRCGEGQTGNACFAAPQIDALEAIYGGVKSGSRTLAPGWPVGAEVAAPFPAGIRTGWIPWFLPAQPGARSLERDYGETFMQYMAFGKPDPAYDWSTFDLDKDPQRLEPARAILDATNPDLSRFKTRGGKILMYFGWADPALNPMMGLKYYDEVTLKMGPSTPDFFKLFMVPGMFHCGGGVGTSAFDAVTPLVEWVEKGAAPAVIASGRDVNNKVVRTRPLCPYPQVARYKGAGSIDDAANFACSNPPND